MNHQAFLLDPEQWPDLGSVINRIHLRHQASGQIGVLGHYHGRYVFSPTKKIDICLCRVGGKEIVEQIISDGWIADLTVQAQ
jgi:hypothetical protein